MQHRDAATDTTDVTAGDTGDTIAGDTSTVTVTTAEAAAMAGVSVRTVRRWIQRGILPATATQDGYLISPADLPQARSQAGQGTRTPSAGHGHGRGHGQGTEAGDMTAPAVSDAARSQLEAFRESIIAPLVALTERQQDTISTQSERIGRLEAERDQLERERDALRAELDALQAAQSADTADHDASTTETEGAAPEASQRPWWKFWDRV